MAHSDSRLNNLVVIDDISRDKSSVADNILSVSDCERIVQEIVNFSVCEIGTRQYLQQYKLLAKLNQQAHISASNQSDEFVLESLLTYGKLDILIHNLVAADCWKEVRLVISN